MIYTAIDILLLSAFLLIVGLWNPKALFFWMDKPSRFAVVMLVSVLVMVSLTLYGEGTRQKQLDQKLQLTKQPEQASTESKHATVAAKSDAQNAEAAPKNEKSPAKAFSGDKVQTATKPVTQEENDTTAALATSLPESEAASATTGTEESAKTSSDSLTLEQR